MSTDERPLPRVPDVTDPRPSTPLTRDFRTGTANDPVVGSDDGATLTVDGRTVTVESGSTLLDALKATGADGTVAALCHYDRDTEAADRIGPRSECRTCMVETDEHGLVPSCSFPVEDGMTVRSDTDDATRIREVNLDLVLSNHNLRCTACGQNGDCELQDTAIENDVMHPRYGVLDDRDAYEPVDDTSSFIQIDRNKCILCNRCVEACNDVQVEGVLRIEGSGPDTRIGFQTGAETMYDSTCVSCGHCATVCPTGSLVEKDLVDTTTMPLPGFSQKNSVGKVLEREPAETADSAAAPNRGLSDPGSGPTDAAVAKKSGVARMMARAKQRAAERADRAANSAVRRVEHAAEDIVGATVPEGVLFDVATTVADFRKRSIDSAETTCGYCAVGCRFEVHAKDDEVLAARPADPEAAPANDFSTCVKGKFSYDFANSEGRLKTPLIRENGEFREASWEEALSRVADGLAGIRDEHGPDALACLASSKCTNEENYLMQKFARQVLGTKNVDNCARLCHSSTVAALKQTVGYGAMTNRIEDVANTDCYLISGSNTTESHPVLATRIKQNVREGADLIVFDPRKRDIGAHATQYTRVKPGADVAWLNGMIRHIIDEELHDEAFIEAHTRNFEELREKVEPFTPAEVERLTDVPPDELTRAAETIATADTCVFGWAMGLTQHVHGTQNIFAMADLALVTGNLGKPNAGLSPFRGQNNVQGGGGDMGTLPNVLPGYQDVTDEAVLDKFEDVWGVRPPDEAGLKVPEMFREIHEGNVRGMYVMGENPAISEPDIRDAARALDRLDFLVVQDIFMTDTAEHADVVLPAATFVEKEGTFTNTERRVQRVRPVIDPPGEARQDWEILQDAAGRLGVDWGYESPAEIMAELRTLTPIYGGITHERLDAEGGLQWPCPDLDHPGTPFLYEDGFNFPDGKARFVPADLGQPERLPSEEFPLTLTSGRVLYHWHTGTLTRRVEGLMSHVGESFVEIHPETARTLGVENDEYVRVSSKQGSIVVRAQVTDRIGPGVVFIPMHFVQGAVNELTAEEFDPTSGIPQYKVTSVRVEPLGEDSDGQ